MIQAIDNKGRISEIKRNQTVELFTIFKEENKSSYDVLKILGQVNLMTPENIHINSFMYEPILDLTDSHLKKLYSDIRDMNNIAYEEVASAYKD